jgi:superfamily II DNA or RNA helicase
MAAACLGALPSATLGSVMLRADQRRVVSRAARDLAEHGGCLVGEDVGRGKTFIALALASRWRCPLVIAPAALRSTWRVAMERAAVPCAFATHESLSVQRQPTIPCDGIIVDESHHFRTPSTNRYAMLARLAASSPIVLLSATPLQNRPRDLAAQIALYHGERAFALGPEALARFVIRSDETAMSAAPEVRPPQWLSLDADDGEVLRAILDLPPPPRPVDGGDAGALRCMGLVRAWASSRAALKATLRTRRRIATAVAQAADEGRAPTRREALAWRAIDDVVQLGFASLLVAGTPDSSVLSAIAHDLERDAVAMERLTELLRRTPDPDVARVTAIRQLRDAHAPASIVAFSEYASTITALFAALRADAGIGMLTAREARIASGRIARDDLLARFAPVAQGAARPKPHERVTLLLATDLLSEGVNLQDASVVLHLDLPWNPARLAQRVGRLRRPGGADVVSTYLLAPPAGAAALLDAEARLRRKLATVERVIGPGFQVIPALARGDTSSCRAEAPACGEHASAVEAGALIARLEMWHGLTSPHPASDDTLPIGGVEARVSGWLAAMSDGRVLSSLDGVVTSSPRDALALATLASGAARNVDAAEGQRAEGALREWLAAERLATTCGIDELPGPLQCQVLEWMHTLMRSVRRHERVVVIPMIARLRARVRQPFPLGVEQLLAEHARCAADTFGSPMEALTRAQGILDAAPRVHARMIGASSVEVNIVALIVFRPAAGRGAAPHR